VTWLQPLKSTFKEHRQTNDGSDNKASEEHITEPAKKESDFVE
jgi:hypothetical protein